MVVIQSSFEISYINQDALLIKVTNSTAVLCTERYLDPENNNRGGIDLRLGRKCYTIICGCCDRLELPNEKVLDAMNDLSVSRVAFCRVDPPTEWAFLRADPEIPSFELFEITYSERGIKSIDIEGLVSILQLYEPFS